MALECPQLNIITDYPSLKLLDQYLFKTPSVHINHEEHILLSYQRARAIAKLYNLTMEDCLYMSPKFWQLHRDPICALDSAAFTLLTIQYNLGAGLVAQYVKEKEDLEGLMKRILDFDTSVQFMLSEVGHGLDAANGETTATLLPNGEFDLNTPNMGAAKWMPPSGPIKGFDRTGIVVAKLIVNGENRGQRLFVVEINDGERMFEGITSKILPRRAASKPVDHAITIFRHVRLPSAALLGSMAMPASKRLHFISMIWRVGIGGLCLSTTLIGSLKIAAYITGKYSMRRHIHGPNEQLIPIIGFRTQQRPILHSLAHVAVLEAYADNVTKRFMAEKSETVRHALGTVFKAHSLKVYQSSLFELSERCGAQGLFEYNQIIENQVASRGMGIAEGDVLALSIRLASELLIGRYSLPPPIDPNSLLARREISMFKYASTSLAKAQGIHRSDHFNHFVLPLCLPLIQVIGHRMAYEAAAAAGVHSDLLALYEVGIVISDSSWSTENVDIARETAQEMEDKALSALLPHLASLLEQTGIKSYVHAPILSEESWDKFVEELVSYDGTSQNKKGAGKRMGMCKL